MKEKILDAFKALGFEMEEIEGLGYGFEHTNEGGIRAAHQLQDRLPRKRGRVGALSAVQSACGAVQSVKSLRDG